MNRLFRIENAALALAAITAYFALGGTWSFFLILILLPDISMLGYFVNPKIGAISYNIFHTWIVPALLLAIGVQFGNLTVLQIALIWAVHIGVDRAISYGLKYETGFKDTHLGRIGDKS